MNESYFRPQVKSIHLILFFCCLCKCSVVPGLRLMPFK